MRIGIVNNLRAGRGGPRISRMLEFLAQYPEIAHVETDCAEGLSAAIDYIADRGVELLVINGGDGTLQHVLTELLAKEVFDSRPLVAPLCGGRTNMSALDFGCRRDPVRGLAELIESVRDGTVHERIVDRPVLRIEYDNGRRVEYGMFFGAGVIQRAINLVHRTLPTGGQGAIGAGLVTAILAARAAFSQKEGIIRPDKIEALVDGEPVMQNEFTLLIASSLRRRFLRLNPFWGEGAGAIRFTSVSSDAEGLARAAPGILRGRPHRGIVPERGYTSVNAESVALRFDCGFTVDGETIPARPDETARIGADRRITFIRS